MARAMGDVTGPEPATTEAMADSAIAMVDADAAMVPGGTKERAHGSMTTCKNVVQDACKIEYPSLKSKNMAAATKAIIALNCLSLTKIKSRR